MLPSIAFATPSESPFLPRLIFFFGTCLFFLCYRKAGSAGSQPARVCFLSSLSRLSSPLSRTPAPRCRLISDFFLFILRLKIHPRWGSPVVLAIFPQYLICLALLDSILKTANEVPWVPVNTVRLIELTPPALRFFSSPFPFPSSFSLSLSFLENFAIQVGPFSRIKVLSQLVNSQYPDGSDFLPIMIISVTIVDKGIPSFLFSPSFVSFDILSRK